MKRTTFFFLLFFALSNSSFASEMDGPFGLVWGMTRMQVEKLGVKLENRLTQGGIDIFKTTSLPNDVSIGEYYYLTFDKNYHLQRMQMRSKKKLWTTFSDQKVKKNLLHLKRV